MTRMIEQTIRFGKVGSLWEVVCDWGIFQADDLSDALSACADVYAIIEDGYPDDRDDAETDEEETP